jgi:hypothetical protein
VAVANQWDRSWLYLNRAPHPGAFLGLHLLLPVGGAAAAATVVRAGHPRPADGRPAIGAAARVTLPDGRVLIAQVDGGNGHSGKRAPELLFGLGRHSPGAPVSVRLQWRDAGGLHRRALSLLPGWHTVVLGGGR